MKTEIRHLLKAMSLGMSVQDAAKSVLEGHRFHGGDWNQNNKAEIDQQFIKGFLKAFLKNPDPTLLFYSTPEWAYGGDKEDGEPPDVNAIRYKCDDDSDFVLPNHPNPESYDLPWYDTNRDAKADAETLNLLVSELLGLEDHHERRMKLLVKGRSKDVRSLARTNPTTQEHQA